jgi:hypothetical protein
LLGLVSNLLVHGGRLLQLMRDRIMSHHISGGIAETYARLSRVLCRLAEVRVEASLWFLQTVTSVRSPPSLNLTTDIFRALLHLHEWTLMSPKPCPLLTMDQLSLILGSLALASNPSTAQRSWLIKLSLRILVQSLAPSETSAPIDSLSTASQLYRLGGASDSNSDGTVILCSQADLFASFILDLFSRLIDCVSGLPQVRLIVPFLAVR